MTIKGMDGQSYNVTGQGQGTLNTVLGAIGTYGALGGNLGGILGGWNNGCCSENTPVNRYELNLVNTIAAKDSRIGLLESQVYTDQKLVEVTKYVQGEVGKVADKLEAFKDAQNAINTQQVAMNATQTSTIKCMQQQIAALNGSFDNLTKNYVPSYNVCQQGNGCNAGYNPYNCGAQVIG